MRYCEVRRATRTRGVIVSAVHCALPSVISNIHWLVSGSRLSHGLRALASDCCRLVLGRGCRSWSSSSMLPQKDVYALILGAYGHLPKVDEEGAIGNCGTR